jgi:hypothetical protein
MVFLLNLVARYDRTVGFRAHQGPLMEGVNLYLALLLTSIEH